MPHGLHADVETGGNRWDDGYPSGGNYWGNYTDVDKYSGAKQDKPGSDGIWDHPYKINDNNIDRYPLVNQWGVKPAKFIVSQLTISKSLVKPSEAVIISVKIKNTGGSSDSYTVNLKLNGAIVDSKTVTLKPGESKTLSFTVYMNEPGTYNVEVDGLTGSFTVKGVTPAQSSSIEIMLPYIVIIIVIIAITTLILIKKR